MDRPALKAHLRRLLGRYPYVFGVLLLGIVLMLLPARKEDDPIRSADLPRQTQEGDLEQELAQLLSHIEGAGKVRLLLTLEQSTRTHYQTDEDLRQDARKRETVLLTGSDRSQQGLIYGTDAPVYRGAVVVCQGADRASVRLAVVEAVASATGLSSSRISVLKMK